MRRKVKLAFMANNSARKVTYTKRKKSLIKKIDELTTLCGIDACAIIYSDFHPQPEVWPSPAEAQRIITKFKSYSEFEQSKKMLNQESYLMQSIIKTNEQIAKLKKNNWEIEKSLILFQCLSDANFINTLNPSTLNDLATEIDKKLEEITSRENVLNANANN